jgi:hypothetical protein
MAYSKVVGNKVSPSADVSEVHTLFIIRAMSGRPDDGGSTHL